MGDSYDHLNEHKNLHFKYEEYDVQKIWGQLLQPQFGFANHLILIVRFHILREVG